MKFKNQKIELPKFTIAFEEKLEEIEKLNRELLRGEIGRSAVLRKCYEFLEELLTKEKLLNILESNSFEEIDMKELELLFFFIKTEYEKPLEEAISKKEIEKLNIVLDNPKISEIIKLANNSKGKK